MTIYNKFALMLERTMLNPNSISFVELINARSELGHITTAQTVKIWYAYCAFINNEPESVEYLLSYYVGTNQDRYSYKLKAQMINYTKANKELLQ